MKEGTEYIILIHSENNKHVTMKKTIFSPCVIQATLTLVCRILSLRLVGSLVFHNHH